MIGFEAPTVLSDAIAASGSPERMQWFADLPHTVRELAERWSLTVGAPFRPGGEVAWVAPVRDAENRDLVLKVAWRHDESEHEAEGMRAWRELGAAHLHHLHIDGPTAALLMERCRPGTPLREVLPEPAQDEVVTRILRRLWRAEHAGHAFRPLSQMCDLWADQFEERLEHRPSVLDAGLARAGMELIRGLPREPERQVLLATDLHAGNILAGEREPWLVIDPKPYVGDPAYDVLQHLINCDRLTSDPRGLATRVAELAGLDPERVHRWLFARCVQESLGWPRLRDVAVAMAV